MTIRSPVEEGYYIATAPDGNVIGRGSKKDIRYGEISVHAEANGITGDYYIDQPRVRVRAEAHAEPIPEPAPTPIPSNDNPDNYTLATTIYTSKDYETEDPNDVVDHDVGEVVRYEYAENAWRAIPVNDSRNPTEDDKGWRSFFEAGQGAAPGETDALCIRYKINISPDLMADIVNAPQGPSHGFWSHGNKIIDLFMWDAAGSTYDASTRQVIKVRASTANRFGPGNPSQDGVFFSHMNGGAGSEYMGDGNPSFNLADHAGEWLDICHYFDRNGTRTYVNNVKVLERLADTVTGSGAYSYTDNGWAYVRNIWGYWDDITGAIDSPTKYVSIDNLRIANGW
jgi:hypothetical protein